MNYIGDIPDSRLSLRRGARLSGRGQRRGRLMPLKLRPGEPAPCATIETLTERCCHFPMWHDVDPSHVEADKLPYCGAAIELGAGYCDFHKAIMRPRPEALAE